MRLKTIFLIIIGFLVNLETVCCSDFYGNIERVGLVDVVWQSPNANPIGLIFLAHGCAHSATDWFPKSASCDTCIGLPVEVSIVKEILKQGYVAVAISSIDRTSKCWTDEDLPHVVASIQFVYKKLKLDISNVPLYAIGASSGGFFVGLFGKSGEALGLKVSGICIQISALFEADPSVPPVVFVHMAKDRNLAVHISKLVRELVQRGVPAEHYPCRAKRIDANYFWDHGQVLSQEESAAFSSALQTAGLVSPVSKLLVVDPLRGTWIPVIRSAVPSIVDRDVLRNDVSPLFELMKLAWAVHEITNDFLDETLDFFKRNRPESAPKLPHPPSSSSSSSREEASHRIVDNRRQTELIKRRTRGKTKQFAFD